MKTITIGFSKSKKKFPIGSWLIRLYEQTPYSHVYLKFYSESLDRHLIYEAVGGGLRFIGTDVWKEHAEEVASFDIEVKPENYKKMIQLCIDNAGKEYGFLQNIGIVICRALTIIKNPFSKGFNCSEFVAKSLSAEGFKFSRDFNLVTPKDIYEVLSEDKSSRS